MNQIVNANINWDTTTLKLNNLIYEGTAGALIVLIGQNIVKQD